MYWFIMKTIFPVKIGVEQLNKGNWRINPPKKICLTDYYPTGKIQRTYCKSTWKKPYGMSMEYYENGQIACKGEWRNGIKTGSWTWYDQTGKTKKTKLFD